MSMGSSPLDRGAEGFDLFFSGSGLIINGLLRSFQVGQKLFSQLGKKFPRLLIGGALFEVLVEVSLSQLNLVDVFRADTIQSNPSGVKLYGSDLECFGCPHFQSLFLRQCQDSFDLVLHFRFSKRLTMQLHLLPEEGGLHHDHVNLLL